MEVAITGIGSYLPQRMLANAELPLDEPPADEDLEKIGVYRRGWAGEGESIPEMAAAAAKRALARASVDIEAIDAIILSNWTQRRYIPELMDDVLAGRLDPSPVIDLTVALEELPAGYAAMDERRSVKVLVRTGAA